jgi:hypothetical protein
MNRLVVFAIVLTGLQTPAVVAAEDSQSAKQIHSFIQAHCLDCHEGDEAEAKLDLASLKLDFSNAANEQHWVRIIDRVRDGEMPPAEAEKPSQKEVAAFVEAGSAKLRSFQNARDARLGRVQGRRLTRREIERSLYDLVGVDVPLADQLPEDSRSAGFTTVANGQAISHFQLEQHLTVVDMALDESFRRALTPSDSYQRDFDARGVARSNPRRRCREPEMLDGKAVIWSSGIIFHGRLPATSAPVDGWYEFEVTVSGLNPPESGGVWSTVSTGLCVSSAPLLTHVAAFEATPTAKTIKFKAWMPKGHMLEIRPGDVTLKRGRFAGGQVGAGEGGPQNVSGIAFERVTMNRVHLGVPDADLRHLVFGDLQVRPDKRGKVYSVVTEAPRQDIVRLMRAFARRAFRRPVKKEQLDRYTAIALATFENNRNFVSALRVGYRALLCSPRFMYFTEPVGKLDSHAIATRLSYFLTGGTPDPQLSKLADEDKLQDRATIRQETNRLLANQGGRQFVEDFAAEWLDLDQIDFTQPDRRQFPRFDSIVKHSMLDETHTYLHEMLRDNLSVSRLFASNYTFLNSRLARYYRIDGVEGDSLRRVSLLPQHHRGGVVTQGAIMKVTANGSNTSPVVRGVWVSERLMGVPIPPPPDNVPAIEPDIRGAKTIREQLAKHRAQASCAVCHVKIDPPGFALENFDPAGQWRDRYVQQVGGRWRAGAKIDPSYLLPDGRKFDDIDDFRQLVAKDPKNVAANVVEKMLIFGTGAPISFADREVVERITERVADQNYGFRTLVHAVVTSPIFLKK